jgi:hypothetical protein
MGQAMEEIIRRTAYTSVMRGCGFGMLGIVTTMMGLANELVLALKAGGLGMLLMAFVLIFKASRVDRVSYKTTEVWVMLDKHERPPEALAARMVADARREAMLRFAYISAILAVGMLSFELLILIFR